jgi:hypothetical protein
MKREKNMFYYVEVGENKLISVRNKNYAITNQKKKES